MSSNSNTGLHTARCPMNPLCSGRQSEFGVTEFTECKYIEWLLLKECQLHIVPKTGFDLYKVLCAGIKMYIN